MSNLLIELLLMIYFKIILLLKVV